MNRIQLQTYLFTNTPSRDRFYQRSFPEQSDRPSQQTFKTLVDNLAMRDELLVAEANIAQLQLDLTTLDNKVTTDYYDKVTADATFAEKQYEQRVIDLETWETNVVTPFIASIPTNYYNKTQADALFANAVTTQNDITALQNDKLTVVTFNSFKDNVVLPKIDIEHFHWNPKSNNDTYLLTFLPNRKIYIKDLLFTNVPSWSIFAMDGNNILNLIKIDATTYNNTILNSFMNEVQNNNQISGYLIVAHTLQNVVGQTYPVPSAITLKLQHTY